VLSFAKLASTAKFDGDETSEDYTMWKKPEVMESILCASLTDHCDLNNLDTAQFSRRVFLDLATELVREKTAGMNPSGGKRSKKDEL
jgi:hypothetical protein